VPDPHSSAISSQLRRACRRMSLSRQSLDAQCAARTSRPAAANTGAPAPSTSYLRPASIIAHQGLSCGREPTSERPGGSTSADPRTDITNEQSRAECASLPSSVSAHIQLPSAGSPRYTHYRIVAWLNEQNRGGVDKLCGRAHTYAAQHICPEGTATLQTGQQRWHPCHVLRPRRTCRRTRCRSGIIHRDFSETCSCCCCVSVFPLSRDKHRPRS